MAGAARRTRARSLTIRGLLLLFGAVVAGYFAQASPGGGADVGSPTAGVAAPAASGGGARVGEPAPDFAVAALGGDTLRLSAYRGRPVLINFFATACGPCVQEMPDLDDAWKAYRKRGLVVLGIGVRDSAIAQLVIHAELTFPVGVDPQGVVAAQYQLPGIPVTVFVDRAGVVRNIWPGPIDRASLDRLIVGIL